MFQKKSQLSIFILIGIVLVIAVAFVLIYLAPASQDTGKVETNDDAHITGFVEGCIDQKSKQALFYLGFIGGGTKQDFFTHYYEYDDYYRIPYYYYDDKSAIDSIKIEKVLSNFMDDNLKYCIKSFRNFNDAEFEYSDPRTEVFIKENEVLFNVDFPVKIKKLNKEFSIGPVFTSKIPLRLKKIEEASRNIAKKAQQDPEIIDWNYLTELGEQNFNATAYTGYDSTIIYRITDNQNKIDNKEYVYQFCVKI